MDKPSASAGHGLPGGTVTFLFTDIEGSTQLLHRLGDDYAGLLADQPNYSTALATTTPGCWPTSGVFYERYSPGGMAAK
jgi:hypothetical protein